MQLNSNFERVLSAVLVFYIDVYVLVILDSGTEKNPKSDKPDLINLNDKTCLIQNIDEQKIGKMCVHNLPEETDPEDQHLRL